MGIPVAGMTMVTTQRNHLGSSECISHPFVTSWLRCQASFRDQISVLRSSARAFSSRIPLVREALVIFPNCLPGGRALLCELLAYKWVYWHRAIKAPRAAVGKRSTRPAAKAVER